ncbi:MAG: hypothetical protein ACR2PL_22840 [Dehalococcoidia bacterium]
MIGRTPAAALRGFRDQLQLAVSCITRSAVVIDRSVLVPSQDANLATLSEEPARLAGTTTIALVAQHWFRLVEIAGVRGRWQVRSSGYSYQIDDADSREIVAYQWHIQRDEVM